MNDRERGLIDLSGELPRFYGKLLEFSPILTSTAKLKGNSETDGWGD
jgi:hypothetical protein